MRFFVLFFVLLVCRLYAQQDPQFTQYMYNTTVVNPAFVGTQGYPVLTLMARKQWLGVNGAPSTQSVNFNSPIKSIRGLGYGVNFMNDQTGPLNEFFIDGNVSYAIETSDTGNLSFGLKLGGRYFNLDASKLRFDDFTDVNLQADISEIFVTLGAGLYYYTDTFYLGVSVPNFITSKHYRETESGSVVGQERLHFYLMSGYVFDFSTDLKFKPSILVKSITGAPVSIDVSANFLFNTKFSAGIAHRLGDSFSALLGFQVNDNLYLGYSYDLTSTFYRIVNQGSHELMLRYEFDKVPRRFKCSHPGLLWF